jgi:hypothetical protein
MSDSDGPVEETPRRYRNPPIEHRFRKGVSGNPRGRPRKTRAFVSTKFGGQPGIGPEDRIKSLAKLTLSTSMPARRTARRTAHTPILLFPALALMRTLP